MSEQQNPSTKPLAEQTIRDEPALMKWLARDSKVLIEKGEMTQEELDYLLDQLIFAPRSLKARKIYLKIAQVESPTTTLAQIE